MLPVCAGGSPRGCNPVFPTQGLRGAVARRPQPASPAEEFQSGVLGGRERCEAGGGPAVRGQRGRRRGPAAPAPGQTPPRPPPPPPAGPASALPLLRSGDYSSSYHLLLLSPLSLS